MNAATANRKPIAAPQILDLGLRDYQQVWHDMQTFTHERDADATDQIWCLQHPPVFTLGQNGKAEHVLDPGNIPLVQCDRGGQVTYHGPGQLVIYLLLDLRRRGLGVKDLVKRIEQAVIDYLAELEIQGERQAGAPGIYVNGEKIAALGLRVRRGCSYHGLSFNVDMDLAPYSRINPCGYEGLITTDLQSLLAANCPESSVVKPELASINQRLIAHLITNMSL